MSVHTPKIRKKRRKEKRAQKRAKIKRFKQDLGFSQIKQYTKAVEKAVGPLPPTLAVDLGTYRNNLDKDFGKVWDELLVDIEKGEFDTN